MPALQIRNVPPDLYERLKVSATRHHRSLAAEALSLLEASLGARDGEYELPAEQLGDVRSGVAETFAVLPAHVEAWAGPSWAQPTRQRRMAVLRRLAQSPPLADSDRLPDPASLIRQERDR